MENLRTYFSHGYGILRRHKNCAGFLFCYVIGFSPAFAADLPARIPQQSTFMEALCLLVWPDVVMFSFFCFAWGLFIKMLP